MNELREAENPQLYRIRHSLAHVLAQAVLELRPGSTLGFGPPVDDGFYYDFILSEPFSDTDFKQIEKKIKSAVTDTDGEVRFDFAAKPGVSNLLSILGAATDRDPAELAGDYTQYGPLKADTAAAVIALIEPVQARYRELEADPGETARLLRVGADKARAIAAETMDRARRNVGLLID